MTNPLERRPVPRALESPLGAVVPITAARVAQTVQASRESPRRRVILPFHTSHSDPLHRMLNTVQPGTYIQPHRHLAPPKAEAIIVLKGSIGFVIFDDGGEIREQFVLAANSEAFGVDLKPGVYHTFVALEEDTVLFEVKNGPYDERSDKGFAAWAPAEGSPGAEEFVTALRSRF